MGGLGSGRPSGLGRNTVKSCRSIDVNRLHKSGCLRTGWAGGWHWMLDGERVASINLHVKAHSEWIEDAIHATAADTAEEIRDMQDDEAMTHRALDLLNSGRQDAYGAALAALREDTREWWAETLACEPAELKEGEQRAAADSTGLGHFLEAEVLPWFETRKQELSNRPLIREQALGEALDPFRLAPLGRYEVHLDRKLERMLSMLLKLRSCARGDDRLIRFAKWRRARIDFAGCHFAATCIVRLLPRAAPDFR